MSVLANEVAKFREWADLRRQPDYQGPRLYSSSEWECDYQEWNALYTAVESFLAGSNHRELTANEVDLLLYTLARDNEDERVLEMLEEHPAIGMQVARASLGYADFHARWQAAVLLGRIRSPEAMMLLGRFIADEEEYVRRRAGFALQRRDD